MTNFMKIALFALALFGIFSMAHAALYPAMSEFTVRNADVERFTDPDNGTICYIILNFNGSTEPISCVHK